MRSEVSIDNVLKRACSASGPDLMPDSRRNETIAGGSKDDKTGTPTKQALGSGPPQIHENAFSHHSGITFVSCSSDFPPNIQQVMDDTLGEHSSLLQSCVRDNPI